MSTSHPNPASAPVLRGAPGGMNLNDSVYERLLRERIIFLGTQVDDTAANLVCAQLLLLAAAIVLVAISGASALEAARNFHQLIELAQGPAA